MLPFQCKLRHAPFAREDVSAQDHETFVHYHCPCFLQEQTQEHEQIRSDQIVEFIQINDKRERCMKLFQLIWLKLP